MSYQCRQCSYSSDDKSNFIRHYKRRKSTCSLDLDDLNKEVRSFHCRHPGCESKFSHSNNRLRHEKKCKLKKDGSVTVNSDITVNGNNNTTIQTIDNSTHNVNNNVNVTVNIQSFDDFVPEAIDLKKFVQYMSDGATNVILKCLEEQQFNIEHPDKMNVFVSNMKDRIARVYDGYRWTARNGDDIVERVFELYSEVIQESVDEFANETSAATKRRIAAWNRNNGSEHFEEFAKNKILYHLYNLRDIVKEIHRVRQRV